MGVYIIAEAGVNHNGSFELACKLIEAAKEAGADCIKFQTFNSKKLVKVDDDNFINTADRLRELTRRFQEFTQTLGFSDEAKEGLKTIINHMGHYPHYFYYQIFIR